MMTIFFIFLNKFWLLFGQQKGQKMPKSKNSFFVEFSFLGSIYIPNFRKFYQTVWILPIFFIFGQFLMFFSQKKAKKGQNRKSDCGEFSFTKRHLPNFRKFHQTVPKIIWDGRTDRRTHAQGWIYRFLRFATRDQ